MRPNEKQLIGHLPSGGEIHRYDDTPPVFGMKGEWEACALYAGESVGLIHEIKPAAEIVDDVVREARRTILSLAQVHGGESVVPPPLCRDK
jgi:nitronate monooxygenase